MGGHRRRELSLEMGDRDRLLHFALEGALEQAAWRRAAEHHLGGGLQEGVDLTVLRRPLAYLRRQERHGEASVLQMVAVGGLWPAGRRFGQEAQIRAMGAGVGAEQATAFSSDGQQVLTQSAASSSGHQAPESFSPDCQQVLTQSATGQRASAVFSPDGQQALTSPVSGHRDAAFFSPDCQQVLTQSATRQRASAVFSPDGQRVLTQPSSGPRDAAVFSPGCQQVQSHASDPAGFDCPEGEADSEAEREWEAACMSEEERELARRCEECEDPISYTQFHRFTSAGRAVWNSPTCPRCQQSEESTFHQLWDCPANADIPGTHLELLEEAREGHVQFPGFWLRGLSPLMWTYLHCMREPTSSMVFTGGRPTHPLALQEPS